jgi:hypothetical protein
MALDVDWLASQEGQAIISAAQTIGVDPNDIEGLRKNFSEVPTELIGSAIHQNWLRKRAQLRWGVETDFLMTTDGLSQATRPEVSRLHARVATSHLGKNLHIIDLTCGLGFDAVAFANAGHRVTAIERDPEIAKIAAFNLRNHDVEVICADATEFEIPSDTSMVFVDPARRDPQAAKSISGETKRVSNPQQWSPSWPFVRELAAHTPVMAKVAPGIDDETIGDWCAEFISFDGDLVEALLTSFDSGRMAVLINQTGKQRFIGGAETVVYGAGEFLVVPDPAFVRARALNVIADRIDGGLINPFISWLTTANEKAAIELAQDAQRWGQVFHVLETLPFTPKILKTELAKHPASAVTIMTRGVNVNVEELRKKISPPLTKSAAELVIALYRENAGNKAIIARRM